jgi:hypothetical protein
MDEEAFKADIARRAVQDPAFRAALLTDPKGTVERALGQPLPDSLAIEVIQESTNRMYLVLPLAVAEAEETSTLYHAPERDALDSSVLDTVTGGVMGVALDYREDGPLNRALGQRVRRDPC